MRIGNNNENKSDISAGTYGNVADLFSTIKFLGNTFSKIMLVNPVENEEIKVTEYGLADSYKKCYESCPLKDDKCGCICKDTVSTKENRCRFIYSKTEAYFVMSRLIKMKYRDYVLVLIMKLNPTFSFGGHDEAEAIDSITKVSSHLVIDPLTKIFNRKYLMDNIDFMMKSASTQRKHLCLACIDIDNFKKFNDNYGHEFGDKVLISVAELMSKSISVLDEAYPIRIGGDEFVIVGIGIDKNRFKAVMNKLCIMVEDCKLPFGKELVGIKISIGVSEMLTDKLDTYKQLYDKADTQLYAAKEAGKGCVR